nr:hypothetical protein [Tanacetum cinerariifolium]
MTDYSLYEVILNGDSPVPTTVIKGVLQPVAPTTAKQRLTRKNELKARGTLLMALHDKHQLKFNTHKDAKTLMEAIEKRFGGNTKTKKVQKTLLKQQYKNFTGFSSESLDQIHDRLHKLISQLEILRVSLSQEDINLKFLRCLPTEWRTHTLIWRNTIDLEEQSLDDLFNSLKIYEAERIDADDLEEMDLKWKMAMLTVECYNCHKKGHFGRKCRSPKDTRRNGAAEPQMRNVPVETSTSNALVSQCDGMGSYDWSFQEEEETTNYTLMAFTSSSSSSDNEVVLCSKACTKAYATLQSHYDKQTDDYRKFQFDVISYKTELKSVEARLLVYQQNESVFEEDIKLLKLKVQLRDNALVVLRQNLEKAEQERDDLKLKLEKFQTSSKNLNELLSSQTNDKTRLGYNTQVFTRTIMPPKPDLVFHNAPNDVETVHTAFNVELSPTKPDNDLSHTNRPSAPIIEDWVSDSEDESKTKLPQNTAILKPTSNGNHRNRKACFVCKSLDHLIKDCENHEKKMAQTPPRNHAPMGYHNHYARMSLLNPQRHVVPTAVLTQSKLVSITAVRTVTTAGNPQHALKDKGVIDSGCSRRMTGNMSYLSDFEELNGGYVAFSGNPKGGKISGKEFDDVYFVKELKFNLFSVSRMCDKKNNILFTDTGCLVLSPEFKLPDENQVLLRVPRENNMYNVNLKNIIPSRDLTCLFAKATLVESIL